MEKVILIAAALALSGCVTTGGTFCDVAQPIRPSAADTLSDGSVAGILAHNEKGAKLCGWRA